jgi:predicted nicotinamide N-methyase
MVPVPEAPPLAVEARRGRIKRVGNYQLRPVPVHLGRTDVEILVVDNLGQHIDAAELLRNESAPEPPYWAHLWPGSRVLARLLTEEVGLPGCRLVDLGCGIGLSAVAAARRGARVLAVDLAAEALQVARTNAAANGCHIDVVRTDLRGHGIRGWFDVCVAADITYDPVLQVAVAQFLATHLRPGGRGWCAESVRTLDGAFHDACRARGLVVAEREETEMDEGRLVRVRFTEIRRPPTPGGGAKT